MSNIDWENPEQFVNALADAITERIKFKTTASISKDFIDSMRGQYWYCQLPMTTNASDYLQILITKTSDDSNRIELQFIKNNERLAVIQFYGE